MADPLEIAVLGSGIIGLCSAHQVLQLSPTARVTLVEASPGRLIAGGASSYAGGFIACGPDCQSIRKPRSRCSPVGLPPPHLFLLEQCPDSELLQGTTSHLKISPVSRGRYTTP